ncbi:MAG: dockerin type I repeat-containing protein [Fimbriimonas sp.]
MPSLAFFRCLLALCIAALSISAWGQVDRIKGKNRRAPKQVRQTLDPIAWLGTEQRKALDRTDRVVPTVIDTRKFAKQIDTANYKTTRSPRNPQFPDWMYTVFEPNKLPVGKSVSATQPTPKVQWPAIDFTTWDPPDPSLAVGKNHVVAVVNSSLSFHTRSGTQQFQQPFQTFLSSLGTGTFLFDPKAFYDRLSDRFFVVVLEQEDSSLTSKVIVAVSDDGNPNGTWFKYRFESRITVNGVNFWLDYPGFGYNRDAIAVCGNMFEFNTPQPSFAGVLFLMADKTPMLTGAAVTVRYILDNNAITGQIVQVTDPNETRIFAVNRQNTQFLKVHALTNPASATPTQTATFVQVPEGVGPGVNAWSTPGELDSLDGRLFNLNYRNGRITTAHAIHHGDFNIKVRWYELNLGAWPSSGNVTLAQSGEVIAPNTSTDFHMPAIGQNVFGDISILFTRSAATIPADMMVASRKLGDAAGSMGTPTLMQSSQSAGYGGATFHRWGDYFDVNIDPLDDVTFWGIGMVGNPSGNWRTHVVSWTVTQPVVVNSVTANSPTILGGTDNPTFTVQIDRPAPASGVPVQLSSNDPSIIVPPSATIPAGQNNVVVSATSVATTTTKTVTITAVATGSTQNTQVTVRARRIAGTVSLENFTGALAGKTMTIGVRTQGTTTTLDTVNVTLSSTGAFSFFTDRTGTVDLALNVQGFLRKVVRVTLPTTGQVSAPAASLVNGDADDDNRITTTDFTIVNRVFGTTTSSPNWNIRADLNGDGTVNAADVNIVQANQRRRGDN